MSVTGITRPTRNSGIYFICLVTLFEGLGMGLVLPNALPMLESAAGTKDLGWQIGAYFGIHAGMQFVALPILGSLSDKFGRKPILTAASLAAMTDFAITVFAPHLWMILVGRLIGGMFASILPTAMAYISDITSGAERTRWFARTGACMMLGFVVAPGVGGVLSDYWDRAPFLAAAAVAGLNLLMITLFMRETHDTDKHPAKDISYNPFGPIIWVLKFKSLRVMLGAYLLVSIIGQMGVTIWPIWGNVEFGWSQARIGVSLTGFAIMAAAVQFFLVGVLTERLGDIRTAMIGMFCESLGYIGIALAVSPLVTLAFMPLLAIGGMSQPAVQGWLSRKVDEEHQGRLMGALAGLTGVSAALAPALLTSTYYGTKEFWPGLVWIGGAIIYFSYVIVLNRYRANARKVKDAPSN